MGAVYWEDLFLQHPFPVRYPSWSPTQVVPPELNENHPVTAVAVRVPWRSSDHEVIGQSPAPE